MLTKCLVTVLSIFSLTFMAGCELNADWGLNDGQLCVQVGPFGDCVDLKPYTDRLCEELGTCDG